MGEDGNLVVFPMEILGCRPDNSKRSTISILIKIFCTVCLPLLNHFASLSFGIDDKWVVVEWCQVFEDEEENQQ